MGCFTDVSVDITFTNGDICRRSTGCIECIKDVSDYTRMLSFIHHYLVNYNLAFATMTRHNVRIVKRILVANVKKHMTTFSGVADSASLHVRVSERTVHGHWLLIYLIPLPSSKVRINTRGLGAR